MDETLTQVQELLFGIQQNLLERNIQFREDNTFMVNTWEDFKTIMEGKGGFVLAHWDGTTETADKIKEETKATVRCIPLNNHIEEGKCVYSGKHSSQRVLFARNY